MTDISDAALRELYQEKCDVRPWLDAGIWGLRLQRSIVAALEAKYGKVASRVQLRLRYPVVTVVGQSVP